MRRVVTYWLGDMKGPSGVLVTVCILTLVLKNTWAYFVKIHWAVHWWRDTSKKFTIRQGGGRVRETQMCLCWRAGWIPLTVLESICSFIQRDHHSLHLFVAAKVVYLFIFWHLAFHQSLWAKISEAEKLLFRARLRALAIYDFIHWFIHSAIKDRMSYVILEAFG